MAVVASIQRGSEVVSVAAPASDGLNQITKDIAITSVDLARSLLTMSWRPTKGCRPGGAPVYVTAHLLNATTIRIGVSVEENHPRPEREVTVEWQVTEYAV